MVFQFENTDNLTTAVQPPKMSEWKPEVDAWDKYRQEIKLKFDEGLKKDLDCSQIFKQKEFKGKDAFLPDGFPKGVEMAGLSEKAKKCNEMMYKKTNVDTTTSENQMHLNTISCSNFFGSKN